MEYLFEELSPSLQLFCDLFVDIDQFLRLVCIYKPEDGRFRSFDILLIPP